MDWWAGSGFNWRALVKTDITWLEWVIGDALRFRTSRR